MSRRARWISAGVAGAAGVALAAAGCVLSAPRWRGPVGPHFDGKRFRNEVPGERGPLDLIEWRLRGSEKGSWPGWIDSLSVSRTSWRRAPPRSQLDEDTRGEA